MSSDHSSGNEKVQEVVPSIDDFPEGGRDGWLAVLGIWIIQFSTFGYTNAHGVFNDYYVRTFMRESSTFQLSWIGSTQLMLTLSMGLISGHAFDVGYFHHCMIGGSLLFVFCLFMLSLVQPNQYYQVFLTQGIGLGFAIGIAYIPGFSVLSHYFRRRRALAMGIATSGSGVGGSVQAIMLNRLIHNEKLGFHNAVRISAGFNAVLLLIALPMAKPRLPPRSKVHNNLWSDVKRFSKDTPYLVTIVGTFLMLIGLYFPFFFLQLNAVTNGVDPKLAFYVITVLNAASVVGRVLSTFFIPRAGVFNIVVCCGAACSILIFCTITVKTLSTTMVFAVLYGLSSGSYIGSLVPMVSSLAHMDSEIGSRLGICFTFTGFGGLIGSPIAGALLTNQFIWWKPIVFSGTCVAAGVAFFTVSRWHLMKRKGTQII